MKWFNNDFKGIRGSGNDIIPVRGFMWRKIDARPLKQGHGGLVGVAVFVVCLLLGLTVIVFVRL